MHRLFDFLFEENCRICRKAIKKQESTAVTICSACWTEVNGGEAGVELCTLNEQVKLTVAHGTIYEGAIKALIYKMKYDSDAALALDLTWLMLKGYRKLLDLQNYPEKTVLVPIPLHNFRQLQRGYNQSELLSYKMSELTGLRVKANILRRRKNTAAQHQLDREKRHINLQGAFSCSKKNLDPDCTYILVDDIHTSGATLGAAARELMQAGATNIAGITIARATLN